DAWEANQAAFEGEGGLHAPASILGGELLVCGDALYETPVAVLQYRVALDAGADESFRFVFAPARDDAEIIALRERHLSRQGFEAAAGASALHQSQVQACVEVETPDPWFDA